MTRVPAGSLVAALALFAFAGTAQAQSSLKNLGKSHGITYMQDTFQVPPADEDHLAVPCPGDQVFFTGGAELLGGPEATYLAGSSGQLGDGWDTLAWDGFGLDPSSARAFSLCGKFKPDEFLGASGDHGVPAGPATEKETAKCDDGTILGGGGFFAGTSVDNWYLTSSYPKGDDGWAWEGYHLDGTGTSEIIAEANCEVGGKKPDIRKESVKTKKEHVKAKVFCKQGVVTGGGGSASEDAFNSHLVVTRPVDSKDKGKVPDDGWAIEFENDGLIKQTFTAYAVCR